MSDQPNISAMSGPQAQARLDQLQADPDWGAKLVSRDAATYAEFDALSRKVAGVDAAPSPALSDHAQGQLDRFTSDPTTASKLLAGDVDVNRRFHELTAAVANSDGQDRVADLILGHSPSEQPQIEIGSGHLELTSREKMCAISQLRESGANDIAVMEIFSGLDSRTGKPFDASTVALAKAWQTKLENDPEWRARLLAGGHQERWQLRLLSGIIANAA